MSSHSNESSTRVATVGPSDSHSRRCNSCRSTSTHSESFLAAKNDSSCKTQDKKRDAERFCLSVPRRQLMHFHDPRIPFGLVSTLILQIIRLAQLFLALAVCIVYSAPLMTSNLADRRKHATTRILYVLAVASTSSIFAIFNLLVPFRRRWWMYFMDSILCINWLAVFSIFGKLYLVQAARARGRWMYNMLWVDLTCIVLWLLTAGIGLYFCGLAPLNKKTDEENADSRASKASSTIVQEATNPRSAENELDASSQERMLLIALLSRLVGTEV